MTLQQWQEDDAGFRRPISVIEVKRGKRKPHYTEHVRPEVPAHSFHPKQRSRRHGGTRSQSSTRPLYGEGGTL